MREIEVARSEEPGRTRGYARERWTKTQQNKYSNADRETKGDEGRDSGRHRVNKQPTMEHKGRTTGARKGTAWTEKGAKRT